QRPVGDVKPSMVDPSGERLAHGYRDGPCPNPAEPFVPLEWGELLRIVQPVDVEVARKDDRGRKERPGQRSTSGLVGPRDEREAGRAQLALIAVEIGYSPCSHRTLEGGQ